SVENIGHKLERKVGGLQPTKFPNASNHWLKKPTELPSVREPSANQMTLIQTNHLNIPFNNVYVKNFGDAFQTDQELANIFKKFGKISSSKVMKDEFNKSRGFGFVCFENPSNAKRAVEELNNARVKGKLLFVGKAMKKIERQLELRKQFLTQIRKFRKPKQFKITDVLDTNCSVCLVDNPAKDCIILPCKHVTCKNCIILYIEHLVSTKEIDSVLCLKCNSELNYHLIKHVVPEELHAKYDQLLLDHYLENAQDIVRCPKSNCQCPVYLDEASPTLGSCPACEYAFCTNCGESYHGTLPCDEFENETMKMQAIEKYIIGSIDEKAALEKRYTKKKLEKLVEECLSNRCINDKCKKCPVCKANIEVVEYIFPILILF
ncbi:E3 ubiquitin-protein ligase RNF14-like protein, partial [Dinothrombium tinctorium]